MKRALKVDPDFCPSPVRDSDELFPNGIFVFNITRMLEYLQASSSCVEPTEITVEELPSGFSTTDESAISLANLDRPVVLAEIAPGQYNLIDGHHRAEKARRVGVTKLKAYKVSAEQHVAFLTSEKAYLTYVEYWNGKVKELKRRGKLNHK
ncbi:ParB N-terminal domain-containing protein [Candidatus Eisenbacteria bacterium]|uniref:ParB N-terminal domain-containing protein n=1 Tax=Eiseniibacteriota bacterium TaxID=2212470 RepID=A0ABV6YJI6_UNCEI